MTKLDVEALKEELAEAQGCDPLASVWLAQTQAAAIIAALEDRDRLRAALTGLVTHVFDSDSEFEAALNAGRAALEGRDG